MTLGAESPAATPAGPPAASPGEGGGRWSRLPGWMRVGFIALIAIVVALACLLAFRLLTRAAPIAYGITSVDALQPGSCLAEGARDLAEYTVIACIQPHPQQVFATAELELDELVYAQTGGALQAFGDEVCDHYLEYRLFLIAELDKGDYDAFAIAVPDPAAYAAGDTDALCVLVAKDGTDITGDAYRPMP